MAFYATSDAGRALVEITLGVKTAFSVGSHVIYKDGCTINLNVVTLGEYRM